MFVSQQIGTGQPVIMNYYTVKNLATFPSPQPGCHLSNSLWAGTIRLFPPRESLVSDIAAGAGNVANLFYSVPSETMTITCKNMYIVQIVHTSPTYAHGFDLW